MDTSFILPPCSKNPPAYTDGRFLHEEVKLTDKPGSVVDSHSSRPAIAHWLKQPTRVQYGPHLMNHLALPGVYRATDCYGRAVRSGIPFHPTSGIPTLRGPHRRFALLALASGFPCVTRTLPHGSLDFPPSARLPKVSTICSGDCPVSFGAYRGFARLCHPALRILSPESGSNISGCPEQILSKAPRKPSPPASRCEYAKDSVDAIVMHHPQASCVRLPAMPNHWLMIYAATLRRQSALYREYFGHQLPFSRHHQRTSDGVPP